MGYALIQHPLGLRSWRMIKNRESKTYREMQISNDFLDGNISHINQFRSIHGLVQSQDDSGKAVEFVQSHRPNNVKSAFAAHGIPMEEQPGSFPPRTIKANHGRSIPNIHREFHPVMDRVNETGYSVAGSASAADQQ
jgi:hypothetical protein